jgi:hypothetical protein
MRDLSEADRDVSQPLSEDSQAEEQGGQLLPPLKLLSGCLRLRSLQVSVLAAQCLSACLLNPGRHGRWPMQTDAAIDEARRYMDRLKERLMAGLTVLNDLEELELNWRKKFFVQTARTQRILRDENFPDIPGAWSEIQKGTQVSEVSTCVSAAFMARLSFLGGLCVGGLLAWG